MNNDLTSSVPSPEPASRRRAVGVAGVAAFLGCAACCALPLLIAAGFGGGVLTTLSAVFRPGSELLVGTVTFGAVLALFALRDRLARKAYTCATSCAADASCCGSATKT